MISRWFPRTPKLRRGTVELTPEEIFMDARNAPGFRPEMQEGQLERPMAPASHLALALFILLGLILLAGRLADLSLRRGADFARQAQANRTAPIRLHAPRGILYDRRFEPLVENAPTFTVTLKVAAVPDGGELPSLLGRLAGLTGRSVAEIADANGVEPSVGRPGGLLARDVWPPEIFIASGELRAEVLEIQSRPEEFPGVMVAEGSRRSYPLSPAAGHLLGYVGRPSREDLAARPGIRPADLIGKAGLELVYEGILRGEAGEKLIEVNARGEAKRERFIVKPAPGQDLILEVDARLQRFAAETLSRHLLALGKRAGALVALDPRGGALRALVSLPAYDPNRFGGGLTRAELERLLRDPANPFLNRAVSGVYPSGSTIKPLLAVAALEEEIIDPNRSIYDPGYLLVPNPYDPAHPSVFKDWRELGWVDMRRALAMSANVYFYTIGGGHGDIAGLGIDRIGKWLTRFGWGRALGIDLPGEAAGLVPGPEKKPAIRPADPVWRIGDTYLTAIGQGDVQVTPLQLAAATAAIANGGTLWQPRVARAVVDGERRILREFPPKALASGLAHSGSFKVAGEGMRQAVMTGSAAALADLPVPVAGKTGTAQTGAYGKNHGWFVGFAPYEDPEIVVVVLVEEGTGGTTDAVPIAKEVLYYYFNALAR